MNIQRPGTLFQAKTMASPLLLLLLCICIQMVVVCGHGRLWEPPSRSTMWRLGFRNPPDYTDNEGNCGGFSRQWGTNGGKCGICGDAWNARPRAHEAPGGRYANGIITRTYTAGSVITASVEITANHKGYFRFRLCPNNNLNQDPVQECFENYQIQLADGTGTKYSVPKKSGRGRFNIELKLPDVQCTQCIFQWEYVAGNSWGYCGNGTGALGCGKQETFRACSDISIQRDSTTETPESNVVYKVTQSTTPSYSVYKKQSHMTTDSYYQGQTKPTGYHFHKNPVQTTTASYYSQPSKKYYSLPKVVTSHYHHFQSQTKPTVPTSVPYYHSYLTKTKPTVTTSAPHYHSYQTQTKSPVKMATSTSYYNRFQSQTKPPVKMVTSTYYHNFRNTSAFYQNPATNMAASSYYHHHSPPVRISTSSFYNRNSPTKMVTATFYNRMLSTTTTTTTTTKPTTTTTTTPVPRRTLSYATPPPRTRAPTPPARTWTTPAHTWVTSRTWVPTSRTWAPTTRAPTTAPERAPAGNRQQQCIGYEGVGRWRRLPGISKWCWLNCNNLGASFCPETHCRCVTSL